MGGVGFFLQVVISMKCFRLLLLLLFFFVCYSAAEYNFLKAGIRGDNCGEREVVLFMEFAAFLASPVPLFFLSSFTLYNSLATER